MPSILPRRGPPHARGRGAVCVPGKQKFTSPRRGFDFAPGRKGEMGPRDGMPVPARLLGDGRDSDRPAGGQRCWLYWSGPLVAAVVEASG